LGGFIRDTSHRPLELGYKMPVTISLGNPLDLPVEAETLIPGALAGLALPEIRKLEVYQGNQTLSLGEIFTVKGRTGKTAGSTEIVLQGDLRKVKRIGQGMDGGLIRVEGSTGMYLGAEMVAGRIHVTGSVDSWAAAEMKGGNIQIEGDAADYLCAGYRGSWEGMNGGRVYVGGSVGREMASHLRRGFIAVKGNVEAPAAARMMGGSIIVVGNMKDRVGIQATRGMIFVLGSIESILPTYKFSGSSEREFVNYYLRYLQSKRPDFLEHSVGSEERWIKFLGDFAEEDTWAEIYVREAANKHLLSR
jgi:formylmethanofuran dehydrogenase subunit C